MKLQLSALLLVGVLAGCNQTTGSGSPTPSAAPAAPLSDAEIAKAKAAVRVALKDPDSAKFGPMRRDGEYVCGTINSKNGFGGYTGAKPFSLDAKGEVLIGGESTSFGIWASPCWKWQ